MDWSIDPGKPLTVSDRRKPTAGSAPRQRFGRYPGDLPILPACLVSIFHSRGTWPDAMLPADVADRGTVLSHRQRQVFSARIHKRVEMLGKQGRLPRTPLKWLLPRDVAKTSRSWPPGVRSAFDRAELYAYAGAVLATSVRDLARSTRASARDLVRLLVLLESVGTPVLSPAQQAVPDGSQSHRSTPPELRFAFDALARIQDWPEAGAILGTDARFRPYWPAWADAAWTVEELVGAALTANDPGLMSTADRAHILACGRLAERLEAAAQGTVAEEIADLAVTAARLDPRAHPRSAAWFVRQYGQLQDPQQISQDLGENSSRVKASIARLEEILAAARCWSPALDRLVENVQNLSPMAVDDLERHLRRDLGRGQSLRGAVALARRLGAVDAPRLELPISSLSQLVGHHQDRIMQRVRRAARRIVFSAGAASIVEVREAVQRKGSGKRISAIQCISLLAREPGFEWLDKSNNFFWFGLKYPSALSQRLGKLAAAAGRPVRLVAALEVAAAPRRGMAPRRPPIAVAETLVQRLGLCGGAPAGCIVVPKGAARTLYLDAVEDQLCRIIGGSGGAATWVAIQKHLAKAGHPSPTHALQRLHRSVVFFSPADGIWAVSGRRVPPARLAQARNSLSRQSSGKSSRSRAAAS